MNVQVLVRAAVVVALLGNGLPALGDVPAGAGKQAQGPAAALKVTVVPFGPTQAELDALKASLPDQPAVQALLSGADYRYLYTDLIEPDSKKSAVPVPPSRFRAVFYDYTNQRVVVAEGAVADRTSISAKVVPEWQPEPSDAEFADAVALLASDKALGAGLASGAITTYRPMPPVQERDAAGAPAKRRMINVGIFPGAGATEHRHEIVGVDLATKALEHYPGFAPLGASANGAPNCGVNNAGQATTNRGTAGQYQLTVTNAGTVIWDMLVIRPSVSSGTRASGIEVRNVMYKGRSVLKRGHVPILNVQYQNNTCGPYRDWQYQEGQFATTTGNIIAPGFLDNGTTPATTALENGTDVGNFKGVAIYREGTEVVLVTELEAGWYRYVHEWRFDMNGAIRPRFGFGSTTNSCTCATHYHHVYFRLDIDVDGPANKVFAIPVGAANTDDDPMYLVGTEKKFARTLGSSYFYRFRGGKRSYVLIPGANDGIADTFGRGDMWLLKYQTGPTNLQAEIDDGYNGSLGAVEANLDQFLNGEALDNQDVVAWYHATITHSPSINSFMCMPTGSGIPGRNILTGDKVVGPDLLPEDL